jgi:hypothetical protein
MYEMGCSSVTMPLLRSVASDLGVESDELFGDAFRSFLR